MVFLYLLILFLVILILLFLLISSILFIFYQCPFIPSSKWVHKKAIEIAKIKNSDAVLDIGCGDGRFLIAVASRFKKARCIGYEISPFAYLLALFRTKKYPNIKIIFGDFFKKDIQKADIIFCYLFPSLMKKLQRKVLQEGKNGLKVVSQSFTFPDIKPVKIIKKDFQKGTPKIILYIIYN